MTTAEIIRSLECIINKIEAEKAFLTELDNVIGDGDHGINLARGFAAVKEKLPSLASGNPSNCMKTIGMTLVSTVGGASGPLFGTGFMRLGAAWNGKDDITSADFLEGMKSAIEGISARGRSQRGEKTMLDAMVPALDAMKAAKEAGKSDTEMLVDGIKAAWDGVEFTKTIAATKGRASYVGERSIGHQDPGATSFTMMLEALAESL